jgi:glycosyltransferase involved in cell wall biosynthesis
VGAEGLPVVPGTHALIADGPRAFADAVLTLLRDTRQRQAMETAARTLVVENYDWSAVAGELDDALRQSAARRGRTSVHRIPRPRRATGVARGKRRAS